MEDSNPHSLERKFIDYFGMTLDQFERLDFDKQEELIKKVAKLRHKIKNNESKFCLKEFLTCYPIFKKTISNKIKIKK